VLLVGLTGGIGSGKSTVTGMLAERGAVVLDADRLARDAVAPGTEGFDAVMARFGDTVIAPDGALDRAALARIVFADDEARAALEAIVHPDVQRRIAESVTAHAETDDVVVVDSPLLIEAGAHEGFEVVVVVTAPIDERVARLAARGMSEEDVLARDAAQMPLEEKAALADVVVDNDGSLDDLESKVDRLWADFSERALSSRA
jgi:dephospho-CoA kinase